MVAETNTTTAHGSLELDAAPQARTNAGGANAGGHTTSATHLLQGTSRLGRNAAEMPTVFIAQNGSKPSQAPGIFNAAPVGEAIGRAGARPQEGAALLEGPERSEGPVFCALQRALTGLTTTQPDDTIGQLSVTKDGLDDRPCTPMVAKPLWLSAQPRRGELLSARARRSRATGCEGRRPVTFRAARPGCNLTPPQNNRMANCPAGRRTAGCATGAFNIALSVNKGESNLFRYRPGRLWDTTPSPELYFLVISPTTVASCATIHAGEVG